MDYTQEFTALQGLIVSADNVHSFSRLSAKGGNEEKFEYVINTLQKFFEERNYITKDGIKDGSIDGLRKLALFLILNADLEALKDMVDIEELELVIWMLPTISKCLMCEIFWNLHFEKFVYETIAFCNPQLGSQLASAFIANIKYYLPMECLNKIKIISAACYKSVCRLNLFKFDEEMLSKILTMNFNNFQKCINYFSDPPKVERLNSLSKDEQYKYKGNCLYTMLQLMQDCLDQFMGPQELCPTDIGDLYTLTYLKGTKAQSPNEFHHNTCDSSNILILDCLDKCNVALLDQCQYLVMDVIVEIFCAWSEFVENDKSMQQKIGELCYNVRLKLLNVANISEHPVVSMIEQIACKPAGLTDIINSSDNGAIAVKINTNTEDKAAWLLALIQKENLCLDETLVTCFSANLPTLNQDGCLKLFKVIKNHLNSSSETRNDLERLAIDAFRGCSSEAQLELLHEHFHDKCFRDMGNNTEFSGMLNATFNKLILSPDSDPQNILVLFLQNPKEVYTTIFNLASQNHQQTNIMLKVMKSLQSFSDHYYNSDTEPCIILVMRKSLEHLTGESQINNYVTFITGLKESNCITGTKLLMLIVMPNLHKALLSKDVNSLYIHTKLLTNAYKLEEILEYRAPLLAMLAQVLDAVRWKINSFMGNAPATLQLVLQLQMSLFATFPDDIPEKESSWLKSKLKNVHPLNMYYYRRLWNPPGSNFAEIISGKEINDKMDTEQLATWLSQIICSSTQEEWCNLWDSLAVFPDGVVLDIFHDAMALLTIAEGANRTPETWACLLYCYRNFVYVIRYKYFKEPLRDNQVTSVIDNIAITVNLMEEENVEELATVLLPLFAYMGEMKSDYKMNISNYLHNKLRHAKFAATVKNVFSNGVTD